MESQKQFANRCPWTAQEDRALFEVITNQFRGGKGMKIRWCEVARALTQFNTRTGKQCRERWFNHVSPDCKKGSWTKEEDDVLINGVTHHGHRWAAISKLLPGRAENAVRSRYITLQRHNKLPVGIDQDSQDQEEDHLSPPAQQGGAEAWTSLHEEEHHHQQEEKSTSPALALSQTSSNKRARKVGARVAAISRQQNPSRVMVENQTSRSSAAQDWFPESPVTLTDDCVHVMFGTEVVQTSTPPVEKTSHASHFKAKPSNRNWLAKVMDCTDDTASVDEEQQHQPKQSSSMTRQDVAVKIETAAAERYLEPLPHFGLIHPAFAQGVSMTPSARHTNKPTSGVVAIDDMLNPVPIAYRQPHQFSQQHNNNHHAAELACARQQQQYVIRQKHGLLRQQQQQQQQQYSQCAPTAMARSTKVHAHVTVLDVLQNMPSASWMSA